jgi:hypothetical protein
VIVVPDTNQFHADPRMRKAAFRILMGQHNMGELMLVVPEVVVREVVKLFAAQLDAAMAKGREGNERSPGSNRRVRRGRAS